MLYFVFLFQHFLHLFLLFKSQKFKRELVVQMIMCMSAMCCAMLGCDIAKEEREFMLGISCIANAVSVPMPCDRFEGERNSSIHTPRFHQLSMLTDFAVSYLLSWLNEKLKFK